MSSKAQNRASSMPFGMSYKAFIPKAPATSKKMLEAEPESDDFSGGRTQRKGNEELASIGNELASIGLADDQSTAIGDDRSEMMTPSQAAFSSPYQATFGSPMPAASPSGTYFSDPGDLSATVEAAAEKGSARAVGRMERELKEALDQLSQLRSDHKSLRTEAATLRHGLAATCAENSALRKCLEMRGVIKAKEFEDQYGYAHRHVKGDFMMSSARGGVGRHDLRSTVAGRDECKSLGRGTPYTPKKKTPNSPMSMDFTPSLRMGKAKSSASNKTENDPYGLDPYEESFGVTKSMQEQPAREEPQQMKKHIYPVRWEVVGRWVKLIFNYRKKHRQDKVKMRPEGDLYRLMGNILFPRCTSHEQRCTYMVELKMTLQRRELIVDRWDGPMTPLRYAVQRDHFEMVKALLRGKANPNEADHKGISLLHFCVFGQKLELVNHLITWKANPNQTDKLGNSPLFFAPDVAMCKGLWEAKADAHLLNHRGQSALHLTAQAGLGDVLLWMSAHVSRQILHHHDGDGASALYYARQSHIPAMTIRKIVECKQSNDLIKRQADIREKAHLPACLTGHLYLEDFDLEDEPGLFGAHDFDDVPDKEESESEEEEETLENQLTNLQLSGLSADLDDGMEVQKKKKKKKKQPDPECHLASLRALDDLDHKFKVDEKNRLLLRDMRVRARDFAARIGREQGILYAHKKRIRDINGNGVDGQAEEDFQKTLTPRSPRVQMVNMSRLQAAQKSREYARQLREKREEEKKQRQRDASPKYRMEEIHEHLGSIPAGSEWRAGTVRNMQMEFLEVTTNAKPVIDAAHPAITGVAPPPSPSAIITKKRFSTSRVHDPVPYEDLYQANRWKDERKRLNERMARKAQWGKGAEANERIVVNDTEAATLIQSAFRRFSSASAAKRDDNIAAEMGNSPTKGSSVGSKASKTSSRNLSPDKVSNPDRKVASKLSTKSPSVEQLQEQKARSTSVRSALEEKKVGKILDERRESKQQEELLARDLQKALERLQTETNSVERSANVMQATLIQEAAEDTKKIQSERPSKLILKSEGGDELQARVSQNIIPSDPIGITGMRGSSLEDPLEVAVGTSSPTRQHEKSENSSGHRHALHALQSKKDIVKAANKLLSKSSIEAPVGETADVARNSRHTDEGGKEYHRHKSHSHRHHDESGKEHHRHKSHSHRHHDESGKHHHRHHDEGDDSGRHHHRHKSHRHHDESDGTGSGAGHRKTKHGHRKTNMEELVDPADEAKRESEGRRRESEVRRAGREDAKRKEEEEERAKRQEEEALEAALALRRIGKYTEEHDMQASKIQAVYRGNQARKELEDKRLEIAQHEAASRVQRLYRGGAARDMVKKKKIEQEEQEAEGEYLQEPLPDPALADLEAPPDLSDLEALLAPSLPEAPPYLPSLPEDPPQLPSLPEDPPQLADNEAAALATGTIDAPAPASSGMFGSLAPAKPAAAEPEVDADLQELMGFMDSKQKDGDGNGDVELDNGTARQEVDA